MSKRTQKYKYNVGFGNHHATEALPNTLPIGQNSPQMCPRGLYAEQLSGSPFTAPRAENQKVYVPFLSSIALFVTRNVCFGRFRRLPSSSTFRDATWFF